ncbi:phage tail protein [Pasteurella multocida]|uniref:phage tail protein n=1 Tax=Pasteurella multocida TaxID=747 RepID=UPI00230170B0|nr:phage tail protein [Pasteurella multocida]MDA5607236.1 phage tail protein [Pasteurella multocida subsp. multocida]MDA5614988.1 phage tail protein [Pasteurella multocida]MDA5624907.1 phage tail protein [Pasteurella multocida]
MGGKRRGGGPVTVGYRYYWDIQSGIGRGPVDEIVEIRVDDKTAYVGTPGELTQSKAIYIDKPNLFGGEATGGEGGIQGRMEILMGDPDQKPTQMLINLLKNVHNPPLNSALSGKGRKKRTRQQQVEQSTFFSNGDISAGNLSPEDVIPGFRGTVTTVFSGLISCYNAYPKKHSYRVRRTHKWGAVAPWYPEKARILLRNDNLKISGLTPEQEENVRQIHAMNPAHILVECATNKSWGGKKDITELDIESYKKAADTLFEEGFGLCIRYNRQGSVKEFVQQIIDHIGAVQYEDVKTGKYAVKLIRNDYKVDELHTFNYDNGILRVQDDDNAATDNAANQVVVKYLDPVTNREDKAIANNIASVRMHGVITKTVEYKGIPTFDLAARVAQRDLEIVASSLTRLKIVFDMRASELTHGDVFKVSLPDRGIESAVFRVSHIENGNEGEFIVTCMQDVFGLPAANYSTQKADSLYTPPDYSARPITHSHMFEIPYHVFPLVFSDAELAFIKPTDCFIAAMADAPTPLSIGFEILTDAGAGFNDTGEGDFTPSVVLTEAITKYQTQIKFNESTHSYALKNAVALMIDDEIVKIESVDLKTRTLSVGRGCADTVPQAHSAGARAWCYLLASGEDNTKYTVNEQLKVKLLTKTAQETLAEDDAEVLTITTQQRQARPYPPGNVKVDGAFVSNIADSSAFVISWAHRDRDVQADNLISHTEDSTILGDGVSYEIALLNDDTVVRTISTTDSQFSYPDPQKVDGEEFNKMTLCSVKNGLKSLFNYTFSVAGAMQLLYGWNYAEELPEGVTEIRFKINVIGTIRNNAIAFKDIVVKGGEKGGE